MSLLFAGCPIHEGEIKVAEKCFNCEYFNGKQHLYYGAKAFCSHPEIQEENILYNIDEKTSLTRKMIGDVEVAFTVKNTEQNEIINYNKRQIEKIKKVVVRFYNIMQLHGWGMSFPNLGELIESLREKPVIVSKKAVEEYINEDRTELQKEVEGLTYYQLWSRFVKLGGFGTFQDSLIYIDWLYREIIEDLRQIIDYEGDTHFDFMDSKKQKYEKLFKEKRYEKTKTD